MRRDLAWRARAQDLPVQADHAIGLRHDHVNVVRDKQDAGAGLIADGGDQLVKLRLPGHIDASQRLIQNKKLGLAQKSARQNHTLQLAPRKAPKFRAECVRGLNPGKCRFELVLFVRPGKAQEALDVQRQGPVTGQVLGRIPDTQARAFPCGAFAGLLQPQQDAHEGGFARPVEADEGYDLPRGHIQVHLFKDRAAPCVVAHATRLNKIAGGPGGNGFGHGEAGFLCWAMVRPVHTLLYHRAYITRLSLDVWILGRFLRLRPRQIFLGLLAGLCLGVTLVAPLHAEPRVVVTIKPLHALVAGVMSGVGVPELLMEGMASPHSYHLRPSEAAMLVRAELVIWAGPGVEATFPETIGVLPPRVRILELSGVPGLLNLPLRESGARTSPANDARTDGAVDPHFWLDPANAIVVSRIIANELSALDPPNAERYQANAETQIARLRVLDAELGASLAAVHNVAFVTFHDAYQYFEKAYELRAVAAIAISPERAPGARTVMELRYIIMDEGVVCVFTEPQFEPRLVATLIEGTEARVGVLDPLGEGVPPGPAAYETIMRNLARDATSCLLGS